MVNASVLIVTQKETFLAATLIAPQDVEAGVLTATIVLHALVHIWKERGIKSHHCDCFKVPPS